MLLIIFVLFLFGLCIGSFLNVVIYRTLHDESPMEGRSHCDHCKRQIAWYDNIPLLSFALLQGRCRYCKKSISWLNPAVELTTGILFVWWYLGGFLFFQLTQRPFVIIQPLFWLVVALLLVVIFYADLTSFIIPDFAVGGLFVIALLYRIGLVWFGIMQPTDFAWSIIGMVAVTFFFFSLWWSTGGNGFGFGDVKFALPMSMLLGWPMTLVGVMLAFILGSIVGVGLLITRLRTRKEPVPFGPFLIIASVITLAYGEQLLHWYRSLI